MPLVILPAKDVAVCAMRLLVEAERRAASSGGFQQTVQTDPKVPAPDPDTLQAMADAAQWLLDMDVPNAQIGLTLTEAKMIEAMLPNYGAKQEVPPGLEPQTPIRNAYEALVAQGAKPPK